MAAADQVLETKADGGDRMRWMRPHGRVLFDARRCPFSHGHAYVLFSRVRNRHSLAAVVDNHSCEERRGGRTLVTGTVTYPELLEGSQCIECMEE